MGLWVMAGSWCADNLTDGWLPDYIAMRLDRDYEENAKMLVQVGLWFEETRDGEPGWTFHEWGEPGRQPSREQVLADRAANAERQKRARDRAKEKREQEESRRESRGRNAVTAPVTNGVSNAAVTGAVTVPPTRPDPTSTSDEVEGSSATPASQQDADDTTKKGARIPDDFQVTTAMVKWAGERAPSVDGRLETTKFINYWQAKAGKDALKLSWRRTWQNWMLSAEQRAPQARQSGGLGPAYAPPSNAPANIPRDEQCPIHRGHRKDTCGPCLIDAQDEDEEIGVSP
jgi:hypothetical protein